MRLYTACMQAHVLAVWESKAWETKIACANSLAEEAQEVKGLDYAVLREARAWIYWMQNIVSPVTAHRKQAALDRMKAQGGEG